MNNEWINQRARRDSLALQNEETGINTKQQAELTCNFSNIVQHEREKKTRRFIIRRINHQHHVYLIKNKKKKKKKQKNKNSVPYLERTITSARTRTLTHRHDRSAVGLSNPLESTFHFARYERYFSVVFLLIAIQIPKQTNLNDTIESIFEGLYLHK